MNPWESFNEYEEEQRQQRIAKQQLIVEELKAKQVKEEKKLAAIRQLTEDLKKNSQERQKVLETLTLQMQEKGYTTSPLEVNFYRAWIEAGYVPTLKPQHRIDKYRVDFAHVESMTVIEIDGHTFHSSRKDRNRDYQRQRAIEDAGWYFVRFTGSEVFADADSCAEIAYKRIQESRAR